MQILLVDDDDFLRDMYATKFTAEGHDVTAIADGAKALELLESKHYDVLLTDMLMPGVSGYDILKQVNASENINCKRIVLTNQSEPQEIERVEQLGVDGYIVKAEALPSEVLQQVESIVTKSA